MTGKYEICSMQILVIAATASEIQPFSTVNTSTDILITGVGVPATIYHLQKRIQQFEYDFIIQAGIAGSFSDNYALGKAVMVKADCFADIGMVEKEIFTPIFNTEFADKNEFPFKKGWLINDHTVLLKTGLDAVKAITVNQVSDSELQKKHFTNAYHADIETMEGAALHYVCLQENIPFAQIRALSNYIGERDKSKWKIPEAIENLNTELIKLINGLAN